MLKTIVDKHLDYTYDNGWRYGAHLTFMLSYNSLKYLCLQEFWLKSEDRQASFITLKDSG